MSSALYDSYPHINYLLYLLLYDCIAAFQGYGWHQKLLCQESFDVFMREDAWEELEADGYQAYDLQSTAAGSGFTFLAAWPYWRIMKNQYPADISEIV